MSILPIFLCGDKILRKKAKKIKQVDDWLIKFIADMFETMKQANGIGLAANQVGLDLSLLIVDLSEVEGYENFKPKVFINPVIKESTGKSVYEEGCLSIPGIHYKIERPEKIKVEYQDTDLNVFVEEFDGLLSRVLQHEIDHLNGKLFIDYIPKEGMTEIEDELLEIKERKREFEYLVNMNK